MKTLTLWSDTVTFSDNGDNCVYDLCFSPDGSQLVVGVGLRLIIYDVISGTTVKVIKEGHKGLVYALDYSAEGKIFASGSQDKSVIVWTPEGNGIVRYTHSEPIQCLAFNPSRELLVSCSSNDLGLWTQDKKNVNKIKVSGKINVCAWGRDGEVLALGLGNGLVSIRNQNGDEQGKIERPNAAAIWGLTFCTVQENGDEKELICVADWGQTLSMYYLQGRQLVKERSIGFDPMRLIYVNSNRETSFLVVAGSNRSLAVYTLDGIKVANLADQLSWIWTMAVRPKCLDTCHVAVGSGGGTVTMYDIQVLIVHALFKSLYAFRVNMTDVKVQNLDEGVQVVMKCRDLIKKVAISKNTLAVQLPEKVLIYQRDERSSEFKFRLGELMAQKLECTLLVMCAEHLVACLDKKLQCFTFNGTRVREWTLGSSIRYIRSFGGAEGNEVLLAGLKDGQVVKIFIDNLFPVNLVRVPQAVRCLDLNHSHTKVAIIDDSTTLYVYAVATGDLLFQEPNAVTVFWNTLYDSLLSFSSAGGLLSIKANGYKTFHQKIPGFVVGFTGTRVFCMSNGSLQAIDISLSTPLKQYADAAQFSEAFQVACLGVVERDWYYLGNVALKALDFETAKKAFAKMNKIEIVRLIKSNEKKIRSGSVKPGILMAEVLAYQGEYPEAAKLFKDNKEEHRAVAMYADLRMFDHAQEFLTNANTTEKMELMKMKADWAAKVNEFRVAAEMYLVAGETLKAIDLMEQNGWTDMLLELGPKLNSSQTPELSACAEALVKLGQVSAAAELFRRFGAMDKVMKMYVASKDWDEVFIMAQKYPEYKDLAYIPYAQWLAEQDRFSEAQKAYHEAGRPEEAFKVLFTLRDNALTELRYQDVSYYHWILSSQYLDIAAVATTSAEQEVMLGEHDQHYVKAMMFYCYQSIYTYIETPFTSYTPESLFNIARYLMLELITQFDLPVPKFHLLYCLAKHARRLEAFKFCRYTMDRIHAVRVPPSLEPSLEVLIAQAKADPVSDNPELLPLCYRCSATNPLLNPKGNRCLNCFHPFVYAFPTFEVLPLIEFTLEEGITDDEAVSLIGTRILPKPKVSSASKNGVGDNRWRERHEDADVLEFFDEDEEDNEPLSMTGAGEEYAVQLTQHTLTEDESDLDPFTMKATDVYDESGGYCPVKVGRDTLRSLEPREVVVSKWRPPRRFKFYKNCIPETPVVTCTSCWMLFHADDLILQMLWSGACPFCRVGPTKSNET